MWTQEPAKPSQAEGSLCCMGLQGLLSKETELEKQARRKPGHHTREHGFWLGMGRGMLSPNGSYSSASVDGTLVRILSVVTCYPGL